MIPLKRACAAQANANDVRSNAESGTIEYNPGIMAAADMVVFVDKPATNSTDNNEGLVFLSSYETVKHTHLLA